MHQRGPQVNPHQSITCTLHRGHDEGVLKAGLTVHPQGAFEPIIGGQPEKSSKKPKSAAKSGVGILALCLLMEGYAIKTESSHRNMR